MRKVGRPKKLIDEDSLLVYLNNGMELNEIAEIFNVSTRWIERHLKEKYGKTYSDFRVKPRVRPYKPRARGNLLGKSKINKTINIVYRFIDETDNIIKYVGITRRDRIYDRMSLHKLYDSWKDLGIWRIEYFECENKSEAEAFESHLITLYGTDKYFNTMKVGWGLNQYLPDVENKWKLYEV